MAIDKKDIEAITEAVTESIDNSAKAFFVDREKHYKHHDFLDSLINFLNFASKTAIRTMIIGTVLGICGIFGLGVLAYFKLKGG